MQEEQPPYQCEEEEDDCGFQKRQTHLPPLHLGGSAVELFSSYRYSGVHLNNNVTWRQ